MATKVGIILARKIVPNYWEIKKVDGPGDRALDWTPVPYSMDMDFKDVQGRVPTFTAIDVTSHFTGE